MTRDEKSYVIACAWTLRQISEVEDKEQTTRYRQEEQALTEQWLEKDEELLEDSMRSHAGILMQAYHTRIADLDAPQIGH